jgi:hypothetical protein
MGVRIWDGKLRDGVVIFMLGSPRMPATRTGHRVALLRQIAGMPLSDVRQAPHPVSGRAGQSYRIGACEV